MLRDRIAEVAGERVLRVERIQSLWGGYGELVRARLESGSHVIAKLVKPPARTTDASDARKRRSYDVEVEFYRRFASLCVGCRVAKLLGHHAARGEWILVLEDLDDAGFSSRHRDPEGDDLDACLRWLANFHACFLGAVPEGLWKIGTYWHLDTRHEELAAMRNHALRGRAPEIDRKLREARFQTLVHGDAKPDNFCFSKDSVAAVDFQYVGGGCGMKDVAYLLHQTSREERGLDTYFGFLRDALPAPVDKIALEREWRELYPVARDDFERFLDGWLR